MIGLLLNNLGVIVALIVGTLLGMGLFPLFASPFGPGLWKAAPMFARIFHTVAQVIRKQGVLVKRKTNEYELGIYDDAKQSVYLKDGWHDGLLDTSRLRWALFGKRPLAITWEPGTDLHEKVKRDTENTDGGGYPIDMGAVHRYLRGVNDPDAITRTEEKAKAEHGGGETGFSDMQMVGLMVLMVVLGFATTFLVV